MPHRSLPRKVTPLQGYMLDLSGLDLSGADEADYARRLTVARSLSVKETGADFGFDIEKWHNYLISDERLCPEYSWGYVAEGIQRSILSMASDQHRRLI